MTREQDAMNRLVDVVERWLELMVGDEDDGPEYAQCLFSIDYVGSGYRYDNPARQGAINDWEEIERLLTAMSNLLAVLRPDGPRYWTYTDEEWEGRPTSCRIDPDAQLRAIEYRSRPYRPPPPRPETEEEKQERYARIAELFARHRPGGPLGDGPVVLVARESGPVVPVKVTEL